MAVDFDRMIKTTTIDGKPHVLVRPGFSLSLYSVTLLESFGRQVADALEAYLAFIPPATLRSYLSDGGLYKDLTARRITTDQKNLRGITKKNKDIRLEYSQGKDGEVGTYAFFLHANALDKEYPKETNLLRLEFPPDVFDLHGIEGMISFITRIADMVPFQSGNAGWAFQRSQLFFPASSQQIQAMLPRYLGFDPSLHAARYKMAGHVFTAHWINLLDPGLVEKLGGTPALQDALPGVEIRELQHGLMLRGAKLPPVGDVNRKALDIGKLPDVARALKPVRLKKEYFEGLDWMGRFDELPSREWDNVNQ